MASNLKRLSEIAISVEEEVRQNNITHRKNREWIRMSREIALTIHYHLRNNGMSQKELAERMDVSPAYVGRLMKGKENLTLETISKVQQAIGHDLMSIPHPYEYRGMVAITYSHDDLANNAIADEPYSNKQTISFDCFANTNAENEAA